MEPEKPETNAKRMLRTLPAGRGFTFFYEFARPTEYTVHSINEFYSTLKVINPKPIQFHMQRGDFERWVRHVVGADKLADELMNMSDTKLTGEFLRQRILKAIGSRIMELKEILLK